MSWENIRYFESSEFDSPDLPGSGEKFMYMPFVRMLDELRSRLGFALVISSGYRTPSYNQQIATTGANGPHTTGKAADILIRGVRAHQLLKVAFELGFTGIGINQKGQMESRFIHLDTVEGPLRPAIWTY